MSFYTTMTRSSSALQTKYLTLLFAGLTSALFLLYKFAFRPGRPDPRSTKLLEDLANPKSINDDEDEDDDDLKKGSSGSKNTPVHSNKKSSSSASSYSEEAGDGEESEDLINQLHRQIEEIDKRGKSLFKMKNFLEAAEVFTEAVDLIHSKVKDLGKHGNLNKQTVTLMNNRSAMYEKGGMPDLALLGKILSTFFPFAAMTIYVVDNMGPRKILDFSLMIGRSEYNFTGCFAKAKLLPTRCYFFFSPYIRLRSNS